MITYETLRVFGIDSEQPGLSEYIPPEGVTVRAFLSLPIDHILADMFQLVDEGDAPVDSS